MVSWFQSIGNEIGGNNEQYGVGNVVSGARMNIAKPSILPLKHHVFVISGSGQLHRRRLHSIRTRQCRKYSNEISRSSHTTHDIVCVAICVCRK